MISFSSRRRKDILKEIFLLGDVKYTKGILLLGDLKYGRLDASLRTNMS